ncbi:MAG: type II toxin-antitoxin system HicB family antitoxin [Bacteroidota bacterium]
MNKILIVVEKGNDGLYSVYSPNTEFTVLNGQGPTVEDAIADMKEALQEIIESYRENGDELPVELSGNIEFEYKYSTMQETIHLKKRKGNRQRIEKAVKNIDSKTHLIEHIPNNETIKAINDARAKKGMKATSIDELFDSI